MKEYEYVVTIQEVGSIRAKSVKEAKDKIIQSYWDNSSSFIPDEEEIDLKEVEE